MLVAEYPNGPKLLNLLAELAAEATHSFVMPRRQMYDTYRIRLRISQELTGIHLEELAETVAALEQSALDEVRLIHLLATRQIALFLLPKTCPGFLASYSFG